MGRVKGAPLDVWVARSLWFLGGIAFKWLLDISIPVANIEQRKHSIDRNVNVNVHRGRHYDELKLVLVVNDDLKMGKGKIGQ